MSAPLGPDMPVPVPKPRTRYKRAGGSPQIHLSSDRDLIHDTPDTGIHSKGIPPANDLLAEKEDNPAVILNKPAITSPAEQNPSQCNFLLFRSDSGVTPSCPVLDSNEPDGLLDRSAWLSFSPHSPAAITDPYVSLAADTDPYVSLAADTDPYVSPAVDTDPYVSLAADTDPYVSPAVDTDPYVSPAVDTDPYVSPAVDTDPYVSPAVDTDPYISPAVDTDPYVSPAADTDPYVSPAVDTDPYVSPAVETDPYITDVADWEKCPGSGSESSNDDDAVTEEIKNPSHMNNVASGHVCIGVVPSGKPPVEKESMQTRPLKQKIPRAATIRVSRRKQAAASGGATQAAESSRRENVVSRSSWLDVWKGRRHNVLWATLDGPLVSLWKKRTDKFTDLVFHVSSITNVCKQDKGRFSLYFCKKHFEFMAHNKAVQEGWVTSLLASRGWDPPAPPEQHGALTMKDPRSSRVYAAICGHNLWIYNNKEDFQLGVGLTYVSMNVASVKQTGRHNFSLITPYKTFNFSTDSSRELAVWLGSLNQVILSALSCSEVAHRLWASPWNKVCADCGSANPEWASVNLLVVVCEACAGQHRSLGIHVSKVRSLKLDSKVWTEPLILLFVHYGNKAANDVWGHNVPGAEQILPDSSVDQRGDFIRAKYTKGRYRFTHPLASSQRLLNQRLCEVVCGPNVPETMSLLCSGARVLCYSGDSQCPTPISLAERAGQAMQTELLRHNEYTDAPAYVHQVPSRDPATFDPPSAAGEEELHGKLEEDRFLFSQENDSAACDVLDLREVISIFHSSNGSTHEFEMVTLTDQLVCNADTEEDLLNHLLHILRVVLPEPIDEEELDGVFAVSRVSLREGGGLQHTEVWAVLRGGQVLVYPTDQQRHRERLTLNPETQYKIDSSENTIELVTGERTMSMQFERDHSCQSWHSLLKRAVTTKRKQRPSLYQLPPNAIGNVPPAIERCISHITQYGLKVDGLYRRCGLATKVSSLVEALSRSPKTAPLEKDEQGLLDAAGALKQYVRQQVVLIPQTQRELWVKAAAHTEETLRLATYRRLLKKLPPDNRITLNALCGHFYIVQLYSVENRMTAQNLALVFVPTLFQELAMNTNMVRLTRELIIHHTLIFLGKEQESDMESEELITKL
ncbi:arf-GAP with Rho-GAP domain, ANK repeat and PH domain-containing protein 1 isoform X1 [Salmo salar]|uniref:Arf-GAP with Rho-GAP domain, ANK repeat and PH domain-containing protein 1 isoform X1 n=1 Tax=Salmo salar TaxID=8030 RepID=A0A1S3L269_SALSA|nr:arf-GAP with Rho-GAP domain, ANK repeat and PH domain-containing protein 1 isoform X1 [Salmo salar]XP_013985055.2 arf-GAP with Rho-GAP domain, ANK repeat and PH domain-containing protein 1 isoform X1 [Salmo salar]XP_013985056.2 arf-GAP with Rho-GAP domain, ANK repeat and PH domain-containing protein 1 isoform X1 [Salmo salar]XP_013985057.2 arf-GAP with Rho-GAP domain, ANK repeat and PH domain-containing protein 1 isoform X1 [Salmo salar]